MESKVSKNNLLSLLFAPTGGKLWRDNFGEKNSFKRLSGSPLGPTLLENPAAPHAKVVQSDVVAMAWRRGFLLRAKNSNSKAALGVGVGHMSSTSCTQQGPRSGRSKSLSATPNSSSSWERDYSGDRPARRVGNNSAGTVAPAKREMEPPVPVRVRAAEAAGWHTSC